MVPIRKDVFAHLPDHIFKLPLFLRDIHMVDLFQFFLWHWIRDLSLWDRLIILHKIIYKIQDVLPEVFHIISFFIAGHFVCSSLLDSFWKIVYHHKRHQSN